MIDRMGLGELLVIVLIIMVISGAGRLPGLARGLGRGIRNFRDATSKEDRDER